jgi:thiol-disulfide isomerase/thioredoxin
MSRSISAATAMLFIIVFGFGLAMFGIATSVWAATPTAVQALRLKPSQPDVDCDRPTAEQAEKCKIVAKKIDGRVGWIVESPEGVILRKFVDTNGDNTVDQWSYYKDGVEVFRDIDSNFNGKVDQCRWLNTGGSRWGIISKENGEIDSWKSISAEEVSAEVVAAVATHDVKRFTRLLISPDELNALGLGKTRADGIAEKLDKAVANFQAASARQKVVGADAVWLQFSAARPGVVPAGTDQSTRDIRVYENATAMIESGGKHSQLPIGTLVQVGDAWRLIDAPQEGGNVFFQASMPSRGDGSAGGGLGEASQQLLTKLEDLDRAAAKASPDEQAKLTDRRADLLEQIADAAKSPDDRNMWLRQLADMIGAAVQNDACPDGADRLKTLFEKLQKNNGDQASAAYVKFRQLTAAYVLSMKTAKSAELSKIQSDWFKTLENYIADYPTASDSAEAMLQLAINQETAGREDEAKNWYARIVREFPDAATAKKAAGAQIRLDSIGKAIAFSGKTLQGETVDLATFRGKVVLIQYWATWSAPAKSDMASLKELYHKYGRSFAVVGVNLDGSDKDLNDYLAENPLPWPQIFETGGLDSRPANALGILSVPTMILVDQQGRVVNRNISSADLETELKKLVGPAVGSRTTEWR